MRHTRFGRCECRYDFCICFICLSRAFKDPPPDSIAESPYGGPSPVGLMNSLPLPCTIEQPNFDQCGIFTLSPTS